MKSKTWLISLGGVLLILFLATVLVFLLLFGNSSGDINRSTSTNSQQFSNLEDKIQFLENYVAFRRQYSELHFSIHYQDNNYGLLPGPSDWTIYLLAQVPPKEISLWIEKLTAISLPHPPDMNQFFPANNNDMKDSISLPFSFQLSQWYHDNFNRLVGIDPHTNTVFYLNSSHGWQFHIEPSPL